MTLTFVIALVLAPAWAYLVGTAVAAVRFARLPLPTAAERPPVTVMKPLHGAEPALYENLRSFARQDYPVVQLVLGVGNANDSALPAARALIRNLPESDIALVIGVLVRGSNQKIANLENMLAAARHDILVLADSDMRVDRHYLAAVTAPLLDPGTGAVTCLYQGVATGGKWAELGALYINFGFLPSVLAAEALGINRGCFGATIALRRETLQRIGEEVRAQGLAVVLSRYLVEARVSEPSLAALWLHELRWARTIRTIAPAGFAGSILTHAVAISAVGVAVSGFGLTACLFLVVSLMLRWVS